MTHDEAGLELSALIDGALSSPRKEDVEKHLAGCGECRERLAGLRSSIALFRAHGRREAPAALKTHVLARAQNEDSEPASVIVAAWKPVLAWSFVAAGVLFVSVSVLKQEMPGTSSHIQGMISGAAGSFGEGGDAGGADVSSGPGEEMMDAKAPAGSPAVAGEKAEATLQRFASKRSARGSRRPVQAVELEGIGGAGVGSSAAFRAAAPEPAETGPVAGLLLFRDEGSFLNYWKSKTMLPAPRIDFTQSMIAVLTQPPPGSVWTVLTTLDTPDGNEVRLLYKQNPSPLGLSPAARSGQGLTPVPLAFRILPKSDKAVTLQKSR